MKIKPLVAVICLYHTQALCGSSSTNPGSTFTTGPVSNHYSLFSGLHNPAAPSLVLRDDENFRFNYLPSFSFSMELGDVNNLADDLDDLIDIVDDSSSTDDTPTEVLDRFNLVLSEMGEQGYIKTSASINAPILPLYARIWGGAFVVNAGIETQIGLRILDAPLEYNNQNSLYNTATSIYLKAGVEKNLSLGFSKAIKPLNEWGTLYAGGRVNIYSLELSKQVLPVLELDGREISDVVKDEYDNNLASTSNIGLDIGVILEGKRYRTGVTIYNINSPEFDYGTVGSDCTKSPENTLSRSSCEASAHFIQEQGEITATETHIKHAITTAELGVKLSSRWWINTSYDLASYDDIVGFENQWMHVSTSFEGGTLLPSLRVGYQANQVGSEISSATVGLTFFKVLNFDLEYGLESVTVDDEKAPRRLGFALSFTEWF